MTLSMELFHDGIFLVGKLLRNIRRRLDVLQENFSPNIFNQRSNFVLMCFFCSFISDEKIGTLDGVLDKLYCRSQMYLSRQMARLRPELTMSMFSGNLFSLLIINFVSLH